MIALRLRRMPAGTPGNRTGGPGQETAMKTVHHWGRRSCVRRWGATIVRSHHGLSAQGMQPVEARVSGFR